MNTQTLNFQDISERKLSPKQLELATHLYENVSVLTTTHAVVEVLDAIREFNRIQREANGTTEKRVPVAQQIVGQLQLLLEEVEPGTSARDWVDTYNQGVSDAISVAGRFV